VGLSRTHEVSAAHLLQHVSYSATSGKAMAKYGNYLKSACVCVCGWEGGGGGEWEMGEWEMGRGVGGMLDWGVLSMMDQCSIIS